MSDVVEDADRGDYQVKITIKNNRLARAIREAGYTSVAAFARRHNLRYQTISDFLCLRLAPYGAFGKPRSEALNLADALGTVIEELFPPKFLARTLRQNSLEMSVDENQLAEMFAVPATPEQNLLEAEKSDRIHRALQTLAPRYQKAIEMRFGLGEDSRVHTLSATAKVLGYVGQERARQIEVRAMTKLRHPARKGMLADLNGPE